MRGVGIPGLDFYTTDGGTIHMTKYLVDVGDGERIDMDLMVVKKLQVEPTKNDSFQATLEVGDKTKATKAKYFGDRAECKEFLGIFEERKIYRFVGVYSEKFRSVTIRSSPMESENPNMEDFERDIEILQEHAAGLDECIRSIGNRHIRALLTSMLSEGTDLRKKFLTYPAATKHHHNRDGGLAEHVLEMIRIAETVCSIYPQIDRDLLVCGCILHDIGKTTELGVHPSAHYTKDGNYLHHIPMGYRMVSEHITSLEGFPEDLERNILHMILSHHGKSTAENPSIVEPNTPEAIALHQIDMMSSHISPVCDAAIR